MISGFSRLLLFNDIGSWDAFGGYCEVFPVSHGNVFLFYGFHLVGRLLLDF